MVEKEELLKGVEFVRKKFLSFLETVNIDSTRERVKKIQGMMGAPDFWNDQKKSQKAIRDLKSAKDTLETFTALKNDIDELDEFVGIADNENMCLQLKNDLDNIRARVDEFELRLFLSGKFDRSGAIIEINAGAGGTEACDWAAMLFRMYCRWAESKCFKSETADLLRGDEAGIKSVTFLVRGEYAYGFLKGERGVHRLVRISPFDSNRRRHTSFASVNVMPEIEDDVDIDIDPADLKIDTYRASGAGGQHVNVTDSAVRIIHVPTGITAQSQNERSQHQNKHAALKILKSRIFVRLQEEKKKEIDSLGPAKKKIEWGSQIRSYVLHPYLMVKDHRTKIERSDAQKVLDGDIDTFIYSILRHSKESRL